MLICVLIGLFCLWKAHGAPPGTADEASQVRRYGVGFFVAAVLIWIGYWRFGHVLDI